MSRRFRRTLFVGCGAILLLLVALYVLMSFTKLPARSLTYILNRSLEKRFQARVSVGEMRGNLINGLDFTDVALYAKDDQEELAYIKKVQLRYNLASLLRGRLFFRDVIVTEPVFNIDPELQRRIVRQKEEDPSVEKDLKNDLRFGAEHLVIRQGRFILMPAAGSLMTWKSIDLAGRVWSDEKGISARIDSARGYWSEKDIVVRYLQVGADYAGDSLVVDRCAVMTALSTVKLSGRLGMAKELPFSLDIEESILSLDEIGRIAGLPREEFHGLIALHASLSGVPHRFHFESDMKGAFLQYAFDGLSVNGTYSDKTLLMTTVDLSMADMRVTGPLQVVMEAPGRYRGELAFEHLDLSRIEGISVPSDLNGTISFQGQGFSLERVSLDAEFQCENSHVGGYPIDHCAGHCLLADQMVCTERPLVIRTGQTTCTLQGRMGLTGSVDVQGEVRTGDLEAFTTAFHLPAFTGTARAQATATGNLEDLDIDGEVDLEGLTGPGFALDSLNALVHLRHVFTDRSGSIVMAGTGGSVSDVPVRRIDIRLSLKDSTIGIDSLSISGEQADLNLAGQLRIGERLTDLSLYRVQGHFRDYSVSSIDTISCRFHRDGALTGHGLFQVGEGSFEIDGAIDNRGAMRAALSMNALDLFPLAETLRLPGGIRGLADGQAVLTGTADHPGLQVAVGISNGQVANVSFDTLKCAASCGEGRLTVSNLEVVSGSERVISGEGFFPVCFTFSGPQFFTIEPDSEMSVSLRVQNLDMRQIFQQISPPVDVHGICSVDITAGQTLRAPAAAVQLMIRGAQYDMLPFGDVGGKFEYQPGQLTVNYVESSYEGTEYASTGTIPLSLGWPFANPVSADKSIELIFGMTGNIPSGLVAMFTDKIRNLTGDLDVRYYLSGALDNPILNGDLKLEGGVLQLNELDNPITDVTAKMTMSDTLLSIDKCIGTMDNGDSDKTGFLHSIKRLFTSEKKRAPGVVSLRGVVDFSDLKRLGYDLQLEGKNIFVQPFRQDMDLLADGYFTISGVEFPHIAGEATLIRGSVKDVLKPKEPIESQSKPEESDRGGPSLDLQIHVPGNFWVEGSDYLQEMSVELKGDLQILRHTTEIVFHFFGDAETLRGKYQIYGNVFRITEGNISFGGITAFDPTLNIAAETSVGSEPIYLRLTGTLLQPQITLSSESGYSEKDIITLLTLGTTSGAVDTTGVSGAFESKATNVLGSLIEGELARRARQQLGVDTFELNSEDGSQLSPQETEVTVGKYLSPKMYLEYSRRLAVESEQEVELEYQLDRHLSFLGVRDHQGFYHLQLQFKFDY